MSLDNIRLNPFLVQQLYKKSLVALDVVKKHGAAEEKTAPVLPYLGKNEKNILVLVYAPAAAFLPDEELSLLIGILTACKLSLADVAVVNFYTNPETNYVAVMDQFSPKTVFLFGVLPEQLQFPLHFPFFQLQHYNDQTYISAPALGILSENKEHKKALWACLQKYISN